MVSQPQTELDLRVRTIGLKRINEARTMAQERQAFSRKGRFNPDGSIKILGEYKLGQKGGTYTDKVPIAVLRPGRESTPPAFHGLTPKRSHPATLSKTQFLITVRRQCQTLSKPQQMALFAQYGAYPVNRYGIMCKPEHPEPCEKTSVFMEASSQVGRLSVEERNKLFADFHVMAAGTTQGCGKRHQQRAAASTPTADWKPQAHHQPQALLGGTGRSLRGTGRGLGATGGRGFGNTGRVGGLMGNTGRSLGMTGRDLGGTGYDLGMTGRDLGGTGRDLGMTGRDLGGTGRDLGMTGRDLGGTGYDLGMTGQDLGGTSRSLAATQSFSQSLLVGNEKVFTPAGSNTRFHGHENMASSHDYGNTAGQMTNHSGTVQVPTNEIGRHGFARNPMGGFFQGNKGGPQEGVPLADLRENPRSGMLSKMPCSQAQGHGSGQALRS